MSPLSIAQYLPCDCEPFDIVVFDEASQMRPWDALGAIMRAKQIVMVGDPKQLPPTAFFTKGEGSEADADPELDSDHESILDESMAQGFPTRSIQWHYRSQDESLIAFSNAHYYDGKLITFPSVEKASSVSFHKVDGAVYDRGKSHTNEREAEELVIDLVERLRSFGGKESVGVVTFNMQQKALIDRLLEKECRKDPSLSPYFDEDASEFVFVRNLESVQGDERDIMYFSITFGPDKEGKVYSNFGPVNQAGGERRLNVAVTRARKEMRVFSSMTGDMLSLSEAAPLGARCLKAFLTYSEKGASSLPIIDNGVLPNPESQPSQNSSMEALIAKALRKKGWTVQENVGLGAMKIALAVEDPRSAGKYLAAVETDGAAYRKGLTARDREIQREDALTHLGWSIARAWTLDWWIDFDGTLENLDGRLRALLEE
jgi:hypothetical protein